MPDGEGNATVTNLRGSDERLAEAFRARGDTDDAEVPEDLRERIWLAVSGALPPEERRELVDRTITDPAAAEVWRVASEVWRASQASAAGGAAEPPALATRWSPRWLAAAAVLLLSATIGVVSVINRPPGDEFRASPDIVVESLLPADAVLPRDRFTLRWTPGPDGSRYAVRVTTEDLRVLATGGDLTTPVFTVEPALLSSLPGAANVLWQVEMSLPTGERLTSPTFVTRVE
jgi:hypothetical protein